MRLLGKLLSSQQGPSTPNRRHRALDLCFSVDDGVRQSWEACPLEPDDRGIEPMCAVLLRCSEQPPVLSITHIAGEREQQVLPRMLAYMQHACDILSATVDHAEMADDFAPKPGNSRPLAWRECATGVALISATARLFVQLAQTPQYRLLLLQHELPGHVRYAISRLADCIQLYGTADVGGGGTPSSGSSGASTAAPPPPPRTVPVETGSQQLALLSTLQLCSLLLGSLWQVSADCC